MTILLFVLSSTSVLFFPTLAVTLLEVVGYGLKLYQSMDPLPFFFRHQYINDVHGIIKLIRLNFLKQMCQKLHVSFIVTELRLNDSVGQHISVVSPI